MTRDRIMSDLLDRYGAPAIARILGRHRTAPTKWKRVPVQHARALSEAYGLALSEMRPDVWPDVAQDAA